MPYRGTRDPLSNPSDLNMAGMDRTVAAGAFGGLLQGSTWMNPAVPDTTERHATGPVGSGKERSR